MFHIISLIRIFKGFEEQGNLKEGKKKLKFVHDVCARSRVK